MNPLLFIIFAGIGFLAAAILVWGGHSADGAVLGMPAYIQKPLSLVLACCGSFCLWYGFRRSLRSGDAVALVVGGVIILYIVFGTLENQ